MARSYESNRTCRRLAATRVFSHCGRARGLESGESAVVTAGRVEAMYRRGIAAFDMDMFWSTGGTLYVGHPRLLREEFGRDPFEWSDAQVPRGTLTVEKLLDLTGELLLDGVAMPVPHRSTDRTAHPTHWLICAQVWTVDEGAALRALLSRGADEVSVVSNAPFALQEELEALRVAQGCRIKHT